MSKETFKECNKSMSKDSTDIETLQKKIDELEDAQAEHIEYVNGLHEKIRQKVSESWETFSRKEYTKLQAQLEKAEKKNAILMEAVTHYAGEPFDTNDIYLDIWDLIKQVSPSVREFDSDTFKEKAVKALEKIKQLEAGE